MSRLAKAAKAVGRAAGSLWYVRKTLVALRRRDIARALVFGSAARRGRK